MSDELVQKCVFWGYINWTLEDHSKSNKKMTNFIHHFALTVLYYTNSATTAYMPDVRTKNRGTTSV